MGRAYNVADTIIVIVCLPLYLLTESLMWIGGTFFARRCPKCSERGLRSRAWIRATCVDESGRRYPDSYTYYSCNRCDSWLRIHIGGRIEEPSEREWAARVPARGD